MPLSTGRWSRNPIVSKYRETAADPRFCSENDPRCGRLARSDVREMPEGLGQRPSLQLELCGGQSASDDQKSKTGRDTSGPRHVLTTAWSGLYPRWVFDMQAART